MSADATCSICGRNILRGERVHGFVEAGAERTVCELCLARAERLGWRRDGEPEPERGENGHGGRWRLGGLLHRRSRRPGVTAPVSVPPARSRPAPRPDSDGPSPFERAVARFNSSDAGRTVTGLTRTLGVPSASIGQAAGAPAEIRITVAWDLSWYQWGVDIGDELRPVFQLAKGREIDQLDRAARQWNATVGEDGRLRLAESATTR
jgi:hypothetical protein